MAKVELQEDERKLAQEIEKNVATLRGMFSGKISDDGISELINQNGDNCHQLHKKLAARGFAPKHHKYMIENRGMTPDNPGFYKHFHPQEDLLKFIADTNANNDPEDVTLNTEFRFEAYSNRRGHTDSIRMTRNSNGWYVSFLGIEGQCDNTGEPYLFKNFKQEFIAYPRNIGSYMRSIWEHAENGARVDEVQEMLNQVAAWLKLTEENAPRKILT